ncbi:MAG: hypothetical protein JRH01_16020 [Deltaproteobacteria bacterium]|nr:hypothetical protein [Deltaproteobacteria bacterium]MBW2393295.1 hypothetical protein [Deltaproteobacteria bacterium]
MQKLNTLRSIGRSILLGGALVALPWTSLAAAGDILSARGPVHTTGPEGSREIVAGDALAAGQGIETGAGGSAAVSVGDLWLEVGPETALTIGPDGSLDITRGLARVVDLSGAGATIHTPHALIQVGSSDTEILVDETSSQVCERRNAIRVAPNSDQSNASETPVGRCAVAEAGALTFAAAGAELLALSGVQVDVAVASHFSPTDVAAPPPSLALHPLDPDKRTFLPCDDPMSCGGALTVLQAPTPRRSPTPTPKPPSFGFGTGPADQPNNFQE